MIATLDKIKSAFKGDPRVTPFSQECPEEGRWIVVYKRFQKAAHRDDEVGVITRTAFVGYRKENLIVDEEGRFLCPIPTISSTYWDYAPEQGTSI